MALIRKESKMTKSDFYGFVQSIKETAIIEHRIQRTKSGMIHLALEQLYESLDEYLDDFIETSFARYGTEEYQVITEKVSNYLVWIDSKIDTVEKNRNIFTESFLQNQIDEILKVLHKAKYRFIYVKDGLS